MQVAKNIQTSTKNIRIKLNNVEKTIQYDTSMMATAYR